MENRTLSQICGRLYFPIFLFRVGLSTLIYMVSLMVLTMLFPSLPLPAYNVIVLNSCFVATGVHKLEMVPSNVL